MTTGRGVIRRPAVGESLRILLGAADCDGALGVVEMTFPEREDVLAEVARGVDAANARMSRVEQIKRFTVLPVDWQPGGDELTPTIKLRRKPIHTKYTAEIEAMYG